ncbi:hypothetical protein LINPERHAP1_LOCUS4514 [Linum perenne]
MNFQSPTSKNFKIEHKSSGWPSGLRRQTQVLVLERGRGFKSHF